MALGVALVAVAGLGDSKLELSADWEISFLGSKSSFASKQKSFGAYNKRSVSQRDINSDARDWKLQRGPFSTSASTRTLPAPNG